jgi:hypothetical protein
VVTGGVVVVVAAGVVVVAGGVVVVVAGGVVVVVAAGVVVAGVVVTTGVVVVTGWVVENAVFWSSCDENIVVNFILPLSDGLTLTATRNIVDVSIDIKVSVVITQLHTWQSPVVKQSILYIHKIISGTVNKTYTKYPRKPKTPAIIK